MVTISVNPDLKLWCAFCQDSHVVDFEACVRLTQVWPARGGPLSTNPTQEQKDYAAASGYVWDDETKCYMDTVLGGKKPQSFEEWRQEKMAEIEDLEACYREQNQEVIEVYPREGRRVKPPLEHISAGALADSINIGPIMDRALKKSTKLVGVGGPIPETDPISNPAYYKRNGLEAIEVIEAFELGYSKGNAFKYLVRAGLKGDVLEDLKKARWYIDREIARIERG